MNRTLQTYNVTLTETTDVIIGNEVIGELETVLRKRNHTGYLFLCSETTRQLFGDKVTTILNKLDVPVHIYTLPNGEEYKNIESVSSILTFMLEHNMDSKSALIALGGGVIGDIATVIAALFYRGIDCVQIPTTLLAQLDSAHGGKGGVNLHEYKNIIGFTRQPIAVIVDIDFLQSLPEREVKSGLGEAVKYGIAYDSELFEILEKAEDIKKTYESIITTCIELKMKAVENDPLDRGDVRVALNFGHSLGHAVERLSKLSHGEAVAVGMTFAIKVSNQMKILSNDDKERALTLMQRLNLPQLVTQIDRGKVREIMKRDKKNIGGVTRLVLPYAIGKAAIYENIPEEIIQKVLREVIS